jgi:flagellar motor switch protein FliM
MKRELSQQEIDAVFQGTGDAGRDKLPDATSFDFTRLDRIPKSQLRAIHLLHENFARNLASSLSAYLRSYASLNLVSLEQISYSEFLEGLSSPTCIAYIGLQPYDGTAVMELNPNLMFGLLELLLGGNGKSKVNIKRKITEIEKNLVQTLMRVVLHDLSEAWKSVTDINFSVQSLASEPQMLHVLAPAEAVVVIAIDVRVADYTGLLNLAIPSIFIKRLRHKFDQLRQVRRAASTVKNQSQLSDLIQDATLTLEARIDGGRISTKGLLNLEVGDVLVLDHPVGRDIKGFLNGCDKYIGGVVTVRDKLALQVHETKGGQRDYFE